MTHNIHAEQGFFLCVLVPLRTHIIETSSRLLDAAKVGSHPDLVRQSGWRVIRASDGDGKVAQAKGTEDDFATGVGQPVVAALTTSREQAVDRVAIEDAAFART